MFGFIDGSFLNVCVSALQANIKRSVISKTYTVSSLSFLTRLSLHPPHVLQHSYSLSLVGLSVAQQLCVFCSHTHTHQLRTKLTLPFHSVCVQTGVCRQPFIFSFLAFHMERASTGHYTLTHTRTQTSVHNTCTFEQQSEKKNKTLNLTNRDSLQLR